MFSSNHRWDCVAFNSQPKDTEYEPLLSFQKYGYLFQGETQQATMLTDDDIFVYRESRRVERHETKADYIAILLPKNTHKHITLHYKELTATIADMGETMYTQTIYRGIIYISPEFTSFNDTIFVFELSRLFRRLASNVRSASSHNSIKNGNPVTFPVAKYKEATGHINFRHPVTFTPIFDTVTEVGNITANFSANVKRVGNKAPVVKYIPSTLMCEGSCTSKTVSKNHQASPEGIIRI